MLLEHPQEPPAELSPAIWKLAVVKFLLQQPAVTRLCIFQGHYGASSAKPTDLLCVHATSDLRQIFERHRTSTTLPKNVSIGKDEHGRYKTQALKAYPQPLCAAIAQAAYAHVLSRGVADPRTDLPTRLKTAVTALSADIGESAMGPDFAAQGLDDQRHDWRSAKSKLAGAPPKG